MDDKLFNIKYVAEQTGLSAHVIRIWERRYSAIKPDRSESNRRLYSQKDIEKLKLLKLATSKGQSISHIAHFNLEKLREISGANIKNILSPENREAESSNSKAYLENCLNAIEDFNSHELEKNIRQASVALGSFKLLTDLISPLMDIVGEKWHKGELKPSNEHFASEIVKNYLKSIVLSSNININAPVIVVTTPKGQLHDVGAAIVSAAAVNEGYQVIYLGANLDYNEISSAVFKNKAKALALSIVHPSDDIFLKDELLNLRRNLDDGFPILIGGRASYSYIDAIDKIKAYHINDLNTFREILKNIRER